MQHETIHCDYETYSDQDLGEVGSYKYAAHPSTDPICLAYAIGDGPVRVWSPLYHAQTIPDDLGAAIRAGCRVAAFNASFEREIWRKIMAPYYGWPAVSDYQWQCVQARASYVNLPRNLDDCARVLGLAGKDTEGRKAMLRLCKPFGAKQQRVYDPDKLSACFRYCAHDVEIEREICRRTPPLPNYEEWVYFVNQRINDRGVPIDREIVDGACAILAALEKENAARVSAMTNGEISKPTELQKIKAYLTELGFEAPERVMPDGSTKRPLDAEAIADALEAVDPESDIAALLRLRQSSAASAPAKFKAAQATEVDGKLHGEFKYAAAGPLRFAGTNVQLQNLRHGSLSAARLELLRAGDVEQWKAATKDPYQDVATMVRSIPCAPPGKKFICSDLSQIEFRVTCWLAGQNDLLARLAAGEDLYIPLAAQVLQKADSEVTKDERNEIGKPGTLGTGYGSGWLKFQAQTKKKTGKLFPDDLCRTIIDVARARIPKVMDYHRELQRAAMAAVQSGKEVWAGKLSFVLWRDWLLFNFPGGHRLYYYRPRIEEVQGKWGRQTVVRYTSQKGALSLLGHTLMENSGQGIARNLLTDAMIALDDAQIDCVLTEHDKVLVCCDEDDEETPKKVHGIMVTVPLWAPDLPIASETVELKYFGKVAT